MNRMLEALKQLETRHLLTPGRVESSLVERPEAADHPASANPASDLLEDLASRIADTVESSAPPTALPEFTAPLFPATPEWSILSSEIAPAVEIGPQHRALRDRVARQVPRNMPSALLLTSVNAGEGKTATVLPLAAALAELDAGEVLAVDGNFRRPALAKRLGTEGRTGLADVLAGKISPADAILRTATPRLSVLAMGRSVVGDASGLPSLVAELKRHFWLVLVDSAAIAESSAIWPYGIWDGTYLVVRLGQTRRRAAAEAVNLLHRRGGRVLGSILTNW
jgi:Mrp family chromosome partitioning ATPase